MGLRTFIHVRESVNIIILQLVCHPPWGMAFDYISNPPLLFISLWFFMSLVLKDFFLTASNHFN